jgi:hydroxyacylglutathione hydrolase
VEPGNPDLRARIASTWKVRAHAESSLPSTIGPERRTNPFLRHGSTDLRDHVAAAMPDRTLGASGDVFAATRALKDRKDYKKLTDGELPIR